MILSGINTFYCDETEKIKGKWGWRPKKDQNLNFAIDFVKMGKLWAVEESHKTILKPWCFMPLSLLLCASWCCIWDSAKLLLKIMWNLPLLSFLTNLTVFVKKVVRVHKCFKLTWVHSAKNHMKFVILKALFVKRKKPQPFGFLGWFCSDYLFPDHQSPWVEWYRFKPTYCSGVFVELKRELWYQFSWFSVAGAV